MHVFLNLIKIVSLLSRFWLLQIALFGFVTPVLGEPRKLLFAVNSPGSAPYLYYDVKQQKYLGVVADFFQSLVEDKVVKIEFLDSNRIRSEMFVYEGSADIFLSSKSWLSKPDDMLSSATLLLHHSYLYGMSEFDPKFELKNQSNKRVCTKRGYHYPMLAPLFQRKNLIRTDSTSQSTMLDMLIKGRCDYAIFNEHNAFHLFSTREFCSKEIFRSPKPTSSVKLSFILSKAQSISLPIINDRITQFKANKELEASLAFHTQQKIDC